MVTRINRRPSQAKDDFPNITPISIRRILLPDGGHFPFGKTLPTTEHIELPGDGPPEKGIGYKVA
jgi:hypothetical protein